MRYKVGYFVGNLAAGSIDRMLSRALIKVAPADLADEASACHREGNVGHAGHTARCGLPLL